jgi:phenylacetate-CoA ligase
MRIYIEASGSNDFKDLQKKVAEKVKSKIGFTPLVYVVELGFLPRSEKKSKRVIDERFD